MSWLSSLKFRCSANQAIVGTAVFIAAFANLTYFRILLETFAASPWGRLHIGSLGLFLLCALILFLLIFSFRSLLKPALIFFLLVSALSAYFMDTYKVIIDSGMIENVAATDSAEVADLLSARLFLYLLLLGLLPSVVLGKTRIREESAWGAVLARLKLAFVALLVITALVLISSAFYASFLREHKAIRYYMNPLAPVYAAYKAGKSLLAVDDAPLEAIGTDARTPEVDIDRELVIMVVGETARADRFSLNGYERPTNPRLEQEPVVSFSQVDSCGTSTEVSVPCMFSVYGRLAFDGHDGHPTENVLDVLGHAGVNLLWRDNNSNSKGVADRIRNEDYRTSGSNPDCDEECRDDGMLSGLQDYVDSQETGDILIILHQMGSHGPAYYKRYPPEFRKFVPDCESNQLQDCSQAEINNAYDNTILYTDHFLSLVIEFLRGNDTRFETAMLYASDHGESLGESGVYLHGLPYWVAPDAQTHVPVILWFGKNYDDMDLESLRLLRNEPLSHDNIFHTLLGLFEISSEIYDGQKDLLQKSRDLAGAPSD
jgi:lipid A ethanolaminephosphotransferase